MRLAIDFLHPAHVHFFRHFVGEMEGRGHEVLITARDKDCTFELLDAFGLPYVPISRQARRSPARRRAGAAHGPVLAPGPPLPAGLPAGIMGPTIALAGKALPSRTVIFYDTEMARATNRFAYPLADLVCTPCATRNRSPPGTSAIPATTSSPTSTRAASIPTRTSSERTAWAERALLRGPLRGLAGEPRPRETGFSPAGKRRLMDLLAAGAGS